MDKRYEEIVLTEKDFGEELWDCVVGQIKLLIRAGYECEVYEEEKGIIVIHYNHDRNKAYGNETIYWLTPKEAEQIKNYYKE